MKQDIYNFKDTPYQAPNGEENVDAGAEFLRDMVAWLNTRADILNDGKTIEQLTIEFKESQTQ
jgi:hypothetical protein